MDEVPPLCEEGLGGWEGTHSIQRACALLSPASLPAHGKMCMWKMPSIPIVQGGS